MIRQQGEVRDVQRRQSAGDVSDEGNTVVLQVEDPRREESTHQQHEGPGDLRSDPPETEDDDEGDDSDHHGGGVRLTERGRMLGNQVFARFV